MNIRQSLMNEILDQFKISKTGVHGPSHWARVKHHGMVIGERVGADLEIVNLFAFLHDSQRENEYSDPDHGLRAAKYAKQLNHVFFELRDIQMTLLIKALEGHSKVGVHTNSTIQTCWDADRLDLGRVGIKPAPEFLSKEGQKWIDFAYEWSVTGKVPSHPEVNS